MDESAESLIGTEIYSLSFDTVEEFSFIPWFSLIQNLKPKQFEVLKESFERSNEQRLTREAFMDTIQNIVESPKYSIQSSLLFEEITKNSEQLTISWTDFIDFLIENLSPHDDHCVQINISKIDAVAHTKRDPIVKGLTIETDKYFCYVLFAKYGAVGIYDGNFDFLTSYQVIMVRSDIHKNEEERRRRNRWITDAVYCPDARMLIITNSTRSITIYDASNLNHIPCWLIYSTGNIIQTLAYKSEDNGTSTLFMGDQFGNLITMKFLQAKCQLLRVKQKDKITLFIWKELQEETKHVVIKSYGRLHGASILQMNYFGLNDTLISCGKDPKAGVVRTHLNQKNSAEVFAMKRGANTFSLDHSLKLLVTGSDDGAVRLWNILVTSCPTAVLYDHFKSIVAVQVLPSLNSLLTCSENSLLKLWSLKEERCVQSVRVKFPCLKTEGTTVEWSTNPMIPGPKRKRKQYDDSDSEEYLVTETEEKANEDPWERSNIWLTCCNYAAKINIKIKGESDDDKRDMCILKPPPLQNSVLIPKTWKALKNAPDIERCDGDDQTEGNHRAVALEHLDFILKKDLTEIGGTKSDLNYKMALVEARKEQMQRHVAMGAPYLALDLFEIREISLPKRIALPEDPETKKLLEQAEKMLIDASIKDKVFAQLPSFGTSSKSNSITEFEP